MDHHVTLLAHGDGVFGLALELADDVSRRNVLRQNLCIFLGLGFLGGHGGLDFLLLGNDVLVDKEVLVVLVQPASDLSSCAGGVGVLEPGYAGSGVLLRDNLYDLGVLQGLAQRDDVAVGLGQNTGLEFLLTRLDGVFQIQRACNPVLCSTQRKFHDTHLHGFRLRFPA